MNIVNENPSPATDSSSSDAWAQPVSKLTVTEIPAGANNLNVGGRRLNSPLQGFGQLWQRTFRVCLGGAPLTPQQVVQIWKEKLPELMPSNNRFYPSLSGVKPGEIVLINAELPVLVPGGMPVATGVLVLYADALEFTVMTPEGHLEAGFNTFSAFERDGAVYAQVLSLARTADPIYEIGYTLFNFGKQHEAIWCQVLQNLAAALGVQAPVSVEKVLVDSKRQWSRVANVWQNAVIRTVLNLPVRLWNQLISREKR
jgi:hypothetical protein